MTIDMQMPMTPTAKKSWKVDLFASLVLPSPSIVATMVLPPAANMNATEPKAEKAGMVMFNAARASVPMRLDMKTPSMTE